MTRATNATAERFMPAISVAVLLSLLSACSTMPGASNANRSVADVAAQVPAQWQYGQAAAKAPANAALNVEIGDQWWRRFQDAQLNALVDTALANNTNLAVAAARVRQAQLRASNTDAQQGPQVSARLGASASKPLDGDTGTARSASASLSANWELDLWGRLAAQSDAAQWEAQATLEDRLGVQLSLLASVVQQYWQLAYLDQRLDTTEQALAYARQTARLVAAQHKAGSVSGLEDAQAQQAVSTQEAALAQLVQTRIEARQTLALLLGQASQNASLPQQPRLPSTSLALPDAGLPAQVLSRRPDMRAAEARLRKAYAQTDATRTAYYPALTLTGSASGSSESLTRVLRDPVGALSAALVFPFLQWGTMQRDVAIAQADADVAVLSFKQTLFQALADVDKALSAQQQLQQQVDAQSRRLVQARQVERLSELRYRAGAERLSTWLDAQNSRRQAELSLMESQYNLLSNGVALVQALGGGGDTAPDASADGVNPQGPQTGGQ